jgi:hypoxanthine phosphoribosyltransferase
MRLPVEPKFSTSQIQSRISELAAQINQDFETRNPLCLITLKGALHFGSDLVRSLHIPHEVDFIQVKSYEDTNSTGVIDLIKIPTTPCEGRSVLVLEDIVDTGLTARYVLDWVQEQRPRDAAVCTLLDKPLNRKTELKPEYIGFQVDKKEFVVGYGMDYNEAYRSLSDIFVLETSSPG